MQCKRAERGGLEEAGQACGGRALTAAVQSAGSSRIRHRPCPIAVRAWQMPHVAGLIRPPARPTRHEVETCGGLPPHLFSPPGTPRSACFNFSTGGDRRLYPPLTRQGPHVRASGRTTFCPPRPCALSSLRSITLCCVDSTIRKRITAQSANDKWAQQPGPMCQREFKSRATSACNASWSGRGGERSWPRPERSARAGTEASKS